MPPKQKTFNIITDVVPSPFQVNKHILRIAIQGKRLGSDSKRPSAITFVVDTSGSMADPNRLPLIQRQLPLLLDQMRDNDRVTVFTTDITSRLLLEQIPVSQKEKIIDSIDRLQASGGTNLEEGLVSAYEYAESNYVGGAFNRVVLVSDGVANLGEVDGDLIIKRIEKARRSGITFTAIGVGRGLYNDELLETLTNKGDGNYFFVDSDEEAEHSFVTNFSANFHLIAKDVKIQVAFNPENVTRYRLIGYNNRKLNTENFRDDSVDAGEIGAGQSVTAIYEIELNKPVDETICNVFVRYKDPVYQKTEEVRGTCIFKNRNQQYRDAHWSIRLASIVAEFAEYLKYGAATKGISLGEMLTELRPVALEMGTDPTIIELQQIMMMMK